MPEYKTTDKNRHSELEKYIKIKKPFEEQLRSVFSWLGIVFIVLSIIMYGMAVYIYIDGFTVAISSTKMVIFSLLSALFVILVMIGARSQGIIWAKSTKEAQKVLEEYAELLPQTEIKLRPISRFLVIETIKDVLMKATTLGVTSYFVIEFTLAGVQDTKYFLLALINIFVAVGLGMFSLTKAYDRYIEEHIPYMKQKIKNMSESKTHCEAMGPIQESKDSRYETLHVTHYEEMKIMEQEKRSDKNVILEEIKGNGEQPIRSVGGRGTNQEINSDEGSDPGDRQGTSGPDGKTSNA